MIQAIESQQLQERRSDPAGVRESPGDAARTGWEAQPWRRQLQDPRGHEHRVARAALVEALLAEGFGVEADVRASPGRWRTGGALSIGQVVRFADGLRGPDGAGDHGRRGVAARLPAPQRGGAGGADDRLGQRGAPLVVTGARWRALVEGVRGRSALTGAPGALLSHRAMLSLVLAASLAAAPAPAPPTLRGRPPLLGRLDAIQGVTAFLDRRGTACRLDAAHRLYTGSSLRSRSPQPAGQPRERGNPPPGPMTCPRVPMAALSRG